MSKSTSRLIDLNKANEALDSAFLDHYTSDRLVSLDAVKRTLESIPVIQSGSSLGKDKSSLLTTDTFFEVIQDKGFKNSTKEQQ